MTTSTSAPSRVVYALVSSTEVTYYASVYEIARALRGGATGEIQAFSRIERPADALPLEEVIATDIASARIANMESGREREAAARSLAKALRAALECPVDVPEQSTPSRTPVKV